MNIKSIQIEFESIQPESERNLNRFKLILIYSLWC